MTRIIHRSKIYTKAFYLSCLISGFFLGWGESLFRWTFLPYQIETEEILAVNLIGAAAGIITGLIAALIAKSIMRLAVRKKEFSQEIHQTSWLFSLAIMLMLVVMILGKALTPKSPANLIIALAASPVFFLLAYQFARLTLFKKRLAGRISVEILIVVFLLLYFVRHPGFSRDIPLSDTVNPNVFIIEIDNLPLGEEGLNLMAGLSPESIGEDLIDYPHTYVSVNSPQGNHRDLFRIAAADSLISLLDFLNGYDYHLGFFASERPSDEIPAGEFQLADYQTESLASKLSMIEFYDGIIPFVDLKNIINRAGGYDQRYSRDPVKLTNRVIRFLTKERDDRPFLVYLDYFSLPLHNSAENSVPETGFRNLMNYLNKSGLARNSMLIFTSISDESLRIPLIISYSDVVADPDLPPDACSLRDLPQTIASVIAEKDFRGPYSRSLTGSVSNVPGSSEAVIIFRDGNHSPENIEYVIEYPYALQFGRGGEARLLDVSEGDYDSDVSGSHTDTFEAMISGYGIGSDR